MGTCFTTMVVKTDICNYSGFKIYPGHGKRYIRSDQRMLTFINGKTAACMLMKRRNLTTKWTVHYRRINKKGATEESSRTKRKRQPLRELARLAVSPRRCSRRSVARVQLPRGAKLLMLHLRSSRAVRVLRKGLPRSKSAPPVCIHAMLALQQGMAVAVLD